MAGAYCGPRGGAACGRSASRQRNRLPLDFAPAWTFSVDGNATRLAASVPGDLITDMQRAGLVGDPLFERNFKSLAWDAPATFRLVFDADAAVLAQPARWLVLDSVKMGAYVSLNGAFLGAARDQFLRYEFDVSAVLRAAANELLVTFPPSNDSLNGAAQWRERTLTVPSSR